MLPGRGAVIFALAAVTGAEAAGAKSEVDVVLTEAGGNKIAVIKVVREATGLGLADAKKAVEDMGTIKEAMPKADAEALQKTLQDAGAVVELQ
jgi:large subunit ribosomal protein L7/L12